ncbi:hypothetical protein H2248_001901 [Termitomyces sp. 'cryptogamus']|nr:hypothetical protein H2248_001901 [Termitomyces sp. 'cryptogamus']
METFNIVVGISYIVNCVTGACTLEVFRKNERSIITTHLDTSQKQILIAFKDLAKYARDLGMDEYQELEKDCKDLQDELKTNLVAIKVSNADYFVRRKKYKQLLEDAQRLKENTYDAIVKIRGQSAAAIAQREALERLRATQREDVVQTAQSVNGRAVDTPTTEKDSNEQNPFSDEAIVAWQGHKHSA